jgi:predicted nucleic acid-binding protein
MILYLDSSVLAKLYVDEDGSDEASQEAAEATTLVTSALAFPEVTAMFARRRRERVMTTKEVATAVARFREDWASIMAVTLDADLTLAAGRLAAEHGLKGADAVHLASFERILATTEDDDVRFLCADERLSKAARKLG